MESYGWRIPFLLAGPLGLVGLYIRLRLADTPQFAELSKAQRSPVAAAGGGDHGWRSILQVIGLMIIYMPMKVDKEAREIPVAVVGRARRSDEDTLWTPNSSQGNFGGTVRVCVAMQAHTIHDNPQPSKLPLDRRSICL